MAEKQLNILIIQFITSGEHIRLLAIVFLEVINTTTTSVRVESENGGQP